MSLFLYIAGIILVVAVIIFLIMFLRERYREDDFTDSTLVVNFLPQYTNGFSRGSLISIDKGDKRDGIKFMPKDIDYLRRLRENNKIEIEPQIIFVEKDKIFHFPRGTLSGEKNEIWLLPPTPEDLPKELLDMPFGKLFSKKIEDATVLNNAITILRKRTKLQDELLERTEGLDIVREFIEKDRELSKDLSKKIVDAVSDKRTRSGEGYSPPSFGV